MSLQIGSNYLVNRIIEDLKAVEKAGKVISTIDVKLIFEYPSFEKFNASNKAIAPLFPGFVKPLYKREREINFPIKDFSPRNPLKEQNFVQTIAGLVNQVAKATGICSMGVQIVAKDAMDSELGQLTLKLNEIPTLCILNKLTDKHELITQECLEAYPKQTHPLGMNLSFVEYLAHNRKALPEKQEEADEVRFHLLQLFLNAKKGEPLTALEFTEAQKCVLDISWREAPGMCKGFSDLFNVFLLNTLLIKGTLPADELLLTQFLASSELKKITLAASLPYFDPRDLFVKTKGQLKYEKTQSDFSTPWHNLKEFYRIYYQWIELSRIEDKAYTHSLEMIADEVTKLTGKRPDLKTDEGLRAFKKQMQYYMHVAGCFYNTCSTVPYPLKNLMGIYQAFNKANCDHILGKSFSIQEGLEIVLNKMQSKNHLCVTLGFNHPKGSHAISVSSFQDCGKFYFYDVNSGIKIFKSIEDLIQYASYHLKDASDVTLTFMTDPL
jgi:hypothetical protein